jgi:hypothetical protein
MDNSKKIKQKLKVAGLRARTNHLEAQIEELPDAMKLAEGLDDMERNVAVWKDDPNFPQKQRAQKLIRIARRALSEGDEPQFKSLIHDIGWYSVDYTEKVAMKRDDSRQEGTRKERRPEISDWINTQLTRDPDAKSPALWAIAPEWITDVISVDRFSKRVTAGRKKLSLGRK